MIQSNLSSVCWWKRIFWSNVVLSCLWCQRIQLLIIDLASSQQQNRPPGPKGGTGRYQRWTDTRAHNLKGKGEQLRIVHVDYNELCLLRLLTGIPHQVWAVTMPRDPFPLLHPPPIPPSPLSPFPPPWCNNRSSTVQLCCYSYPHM